ncbi:uncharacterized protein N7458_007795 [Penicillium daleae]|uniref:Uncharacterized protein n=1 Tax=Penicillium daleae TaxID=63821 RepID=A0AAD6G176_9EURO|nr:uncharacterized protein N7458_007795 [Penicillium daleae]KAJ5443923.1 hypothetical protein N7458_007795 [Penicillium daleae]
MPPIADLRPLPPTVVGPTTKKATRLSNMLPQSLIYGAQVTEKEIFNPKKHLNFQHPKGVTTMKEIGVEGAWNITSRCFRIVLVVYSPCYQANSRRAPFTCDAWSSPELLAVVSEVAGVDLVVAFDYEITNINISINDDLSTTAEFSKEPETLAFAWHYDSFPFVCVTMLPDCSDMVGGETAIRTPSGEIKKIHGPAMWIGTAVVMQGRYIENQALKALGGRKRISMVTPFGPWNPFIRDELYRLVLLEERIRLKLKEERKRVDTKHVFNISDMTGFVAVQKDLLEAAIAELIEVEDLD